jgi:hypothetical protein
MDGDNGQKWIEQKLISLFDGEEWDTVRVLLRRVSDKNQFITANIVVMLERCDIHTSELQAAIAQAKAHLPVFQKAHRTYHWPLKDGYALPTNAPFLGNFKLYALDADADCTAFQQLALKETKQPPEHTAAICSDLDFYRFDKRFRLPSFQNEFSELVKGTFLSWFPAKEKCQVGKNGKGKLEQFDVVVDAHVLWFLNEMNVADCVGVKETLALIKHLVRSDVILKKPYNVSPYYPFAAVILYALSRAIVWGNITELNTLRPELLSLAKRCKAVTLFEKLCLASVGAFWNDAELLSRYDFSKVRSMPTSAFYAATQAAPVFEFFSRESFSRFEFHSEALQWAMRLYLIQHGSKRVR